jgi:hypothetical protein
MPPAQEQEKIAFILSSMDRAQSINYKKKEKYATLKRGILEDIFNQKVQIN